MKAVVIGETDCMACHLPRMKWLPWQRKRRRSGTFWRPPYIRLDMFFLERVKNSLLASIFARRLILA